MYNTNYTFIVYLYALLIKQLKKDFENDLIANAVRQRHILVGTY